MRKVIVAAVSALMLLTACQKKDENAYTINGTIAGQDLNGKYAYIMEKEGTERVAKDSALIEADKFTFEGSVAPEEVRLVEIFLEGFNDRFVLEPGTININIDFAAPVKAGLVTGTPLNDELSAFNRGIAERVVKFNEERAKITKDESLDDDAKKEAYQKLYDEINGSLNEHAKASYEKNKETILAPYIFANLAGQLEGEELIKAYESAPEIVKANESVKSMYERAIGASKTKEGMEFSDFDAIQEDGSVVKFSSFVDGKNLLLVDFWASWCGPCVRSMPFIKNVYEKYGKKGLRVLGVNTWENNVDNYKKGVEEHGIVWESIYDEKSAGATTYGVQGIPHLMLISPDGIILKRGIIPDELEKVVKENLRR